MTVEGIERTGERAGAEDPAGVEARNNEVVMLDARNEGGRVSVCIHEKRRERGSTLCAAGGRVRQPEGVCRRDRDRGSVELRCAAGCVEGGSGLHSEGDRVVVYAVGIRRKVWVC